MEKIPVNSTSETETTRIEDTSLPENIQDLETIRSEEIENSKERDDLSTSDAILIGKDNNDTSDNSVNIKVSQQSLDAVADNMDKFKINSTMVTKEPESCEALKSETNTEIMKNNLISEGSQVAHTNVTLQYLSPIRFHRVHGKCIKMSDDYCTARLQTRSVERFSLAECMVFSSRPINVDEKVFVCLELNPYIQSRDFYFSFTDCDPNTMTDFKFPYWHKTVQFSWYTFKHEERVIIFRFCVKPSGEVWCGVNDTDMELLFEKININVPLWACIIPTHFLNSLKLIDCPNENETEPPSLENYSPPTINASTELGKTDQKQDKKRDEIKLKPDTKADLDEKTKENEKNASTALGRGNGVTPTNVTALDLPPVRFHRVHGVYIKMSDDYCTARLEIPDLPEIVQQRSLTTENKCLVFSSRPIADGEKVYLRLKIVPSILQSSVQFGLTNCDPNSITDLNSWNYNKWLYLFRKSENTETITVYTLHFCVKRSGKLTCCLKDDILKFGFKNFNISGPLWAVLNLPDNVTNVEFINSPKGTKFEEYKLLSKEKSSPPTTDALIKLKNLIGNVSNLKLDSTMTKEKPKSYEAFKPLANIEKIKSPLNAEDDGTSRTDCAVDVLTALRFHRVHGRFVTISDDYCTAQSAIPKEKPFLVTHECFAFSSRPVAINEKVYLRLGKISSPYIHPFGFGFTDINPNIIVDILPKLCPCRTCIFSNCLNNLPYNFGSEGYIFFFFLKPSGEVCYGINDKEIGSVSKVINVKIPLWGLIKLSHDISTVTLIEYQEGNKSEDLKSPSIRKPIQLNSTKITTDNTENKKADVLKLPAPSSGISPEKPTLYRSGETPVRTIPYESFRFHSVHGKYIKLSPDKTIANCEMPGVESYYETHECYVFSSRPIDINEKVHLKLEAVSKKCLNDFRFGFTDCDPCIIPNIMSRLCQSSPCIFGKYLTALPNQFCVKDNHLHFYVTKAGEVHFMVNEEEKGVCCRGVNISSRIWAVIKVTNFVSSVRLQNIKQDSFNSYFSGEVSSALETLSSTKKDETGTTNKNTKTKGDDEKKNIPADSNILTGMPKTDVTSNTKGQTLFDWGDAVADNMDKFKINPTMVTKEPESCEALKSETNTEIMKNNLISEGSQVAHTNVTLQDLSPIRFHRVHGKCIKMSDDYCTARLCSRAVLRCSTLRVCTRGVEENVEQNVERFSLADCMVFSSRPINVDEKLFLRLELNAFIQFSDFYFGFTDCDPNTMTDLKFPYWHKTVQLSWYTFKDEDCVTIFRFCVKPSGEVWCGVNDTDMELLFEKININVPLWACIIPTHCLKSLKLIDCPNENETEPPSLENYSPPTINASTELGKTDQKQDRKRDETKLKPDTKADLDEKTKENEENASTALGRGNGVTPTNVTALDLPPVRFHRVHGVYIKMSDDYCTARLEIPDLPGIVQKRSLTTENKRLVFSSRPIADGEKVYLRLKIVPSILQSSIQFGLTNCDPNSITNLNSWNYNKWQYLFLKSENTETITVYTLHFCVKRSGKLTCCLKDDILKFGFKNFNISGPLWAVLNLPDNVTNVEFINSPKGTKFEEYKLLSKEKSSPQTTDALIKLKNLIGNVSNLKLDSTMTKEKPKSYEAFKPLANIEKIKSPLNAEDDGTSRTDCALDVLTPLRFHRVHGRFVTISDDYCTAQSAILPKERPFVVTHECFAFSSRPVAINEKVYLRLGKISSPFIHPFGFGFTDINPNIIVDILPKLCPFRTCIFSNCLNNLPYNFGSEGYIFFFFLKPSGEVCYGINDKEIGSVSKVINVKIPLWGLIKLSHDISTVTLIEYQEGNKSEDLKSPSIRKPIQLNSTKITTDNTENKKADVLKLPAPSSGISPEKPTLYRSGETPVRTIHYESFRFHSVHGKYIKLSPDKTIANCEIPGVESYYETHECYVFSSRPIDINEKVHLKLEAVSKKCLNDFRFGFTDCDPCIIPNIMSRLCQSSPCIFGNYLTALPNQFCVKDNHLHFYVTKAGEVHFMVNEEEKGVCCRGVNISSRIWAVIKVTNFVSSVRLQNIKRDSFNSYFSGEVSSALKTSSSTKKDETGTTNKNTKTKGDDEKKIIPADSNIHTGMPKTDVTSNTKGQTLFDWGVESSVKTEPKFKKNELTSELTVHEALKLNIQPSTSSTSAKLFQPNSSTDVKYTQKPDSDATHFAKIVEYQLNRVPQD